ncbi:Hypothetical protein mma_0654 [Janthinobacterium sp. Marseille]|nr:Hypothetical protein mma_0654 [Janthinobacterium sp. Marseille]
MFTRCRTRAVVENCCRNSHERDYRDDLLRGYLKVFLTRSWRAFSSCSWALRLSRPSIRSPNSNQRKANANKPTIAHHDRSATGPTSKYFKTVNSTIAIMSGMSSPFGCSIL